MADMDDSNCVSMTDYSSGSDLSTTKANDEDYSNISNSTVTETVVNNDHAVGRDAGSVGERTDPPDVSDSAYGTKQIGAVLSDRDESNGKTNSELSQSNNSSQLTFASKEKENVFMSSLPTIHNNAMPQEDLKENSTRSKPTNLENEGDSSGEALSVQDPDEHFKEEGNAWCKPNESEEADNNDVPLTVETVKAELDVNNLVTEQAANVTSVLEDPCENEDKEKFNVESLNYELQVGYRILSNMMSASNRCVNKLFLFPVDDNFPETAAYYEKVKKPMWMFKMKEKFETHQYDDITEFMADFRLMIENCYRFNGPDNFVSKKAQKLETMMKQKVALLSKNLRDKILGASAANEDDLLTSAGLRRRVRNPNTTMDDASQQLLSQLRKDRELQEKVDRRQKVEDRRAMELARLQELQTWEDNLLGSEVKEHIRTMWELPQIGLFVYLCMESLGLEEEVTQYQIERGLAVPRECSDFGRLMTCLLSTPHQRKNLKSFMPYHVWNSKLGEKLDYFYKVLSEKNFNHTQACYKLGFDLRAFKMMGEKNPMGRKKFHELSFLKRVWILKNYCDFCLETQQYLQKTIEDIEAVRPNDVREVLLGSDGRGYRYLNFPMFTGKDIRIYKHQKLPEPTLESLFMEDWSVDAEKPSASSSRCSTPINQRSSRQVETPLNSLRARALLQAAESKEASPFRDTSRAGSESMDSTTPNPLLDNQENTQSASALKPVNLKKRKKTSIFTGKKKRLKIKKTDCSVVPAVSGDNSIAEENSIVSSDSPNEPALEALSAYSAQKDVTKMDDVPVVCDTIVQKEKESYMLNISSKDIPVVDTNNPSSSPVNQYQSSPPAAEPVPFEKGLIAAPEVEAVGEKQLSASVGKFSTPKSSEDKLSPQLPTSDKQLYSASLSCEVDKSGRGDRESSLPGESLEQSSGEIGDSSSQHSLQTENQNEANHLAHVKEENTSDGEMKKEPQVKSEPVETVEMGTDGIKQETVSGNVTLNLDSVDSKLDQQNPLAEKCFGELSDILVKTEDGKGSLNNLEETIKKENDQSKWPLSPEPTTQSKSNGCVSDATASGEQRSTCPELMDTAESADNKKSDSENDTPTKEDQGESNGADKSIMGDNAEERNEEESDEDELDIPERGRIELVAESMEDIRQLMNKLSNPEPIRRGKKVYPGVIKPCEEELLANLTRFHDDLLKFEKSLVNARAGMQVKLRKEVDTYTEPKIGDSKGWDSDHSQSTKDSSEDEEEEEEEGEPDDKADGEGSRKSKRIKAKQQVAATTSLLTSAASKLSAITDNGTNEDSNDSFELDISSRGRLRKRRIIPNNTEDTGLRKRKLIDSLNGSATPTTGADTALSSSDVSSSTTPLSTSASTLSFPTVIQRQPGKPWPSHILSMLTSGGLSASSSAIRAQLGGQIVTSKAGSSTGLQQHLLAGQVFRLVAPGADGNVRALQVSGNVSGARGLHATPGSVIISPQNLASIRFVSSTGVVTLPRERILSAGSSSTSATSLSSSPAQASHPVIQQLLLNKSAKGQASPSKVTFVPNVTVNSGLTNQTLQQQIGLAGSTVPKRSVVVTLSPATSTITLHQQSVPSNRPPLLKSPMVMVTPQNTPKLAGAAAGVSGTAAAPVVVSHVSSSVSGGKQVLDLGSLSVTQIQQLMRNQAIQINMGGAGSGPTTLLLTTGLQQLGAITSSSSSVVGSNTVGAGSTTAGLPDIRFQQQQAQQTIRPPVVAATGASSLLAMINNKGQKLVPLPACSSITCSVVTSTVASGHLLSGHHTVPPHLVAMINSKVQKLVTVPASSTITCSVVTSTVSSGHQLSGHHLVPPHLVNSQLVIKAEANSATTTSLALTNPALKSVLGNRATVPQSVLTSKVLASSVQNRVTLVSGSTIVAANSNNNNQSARIALPVPQIISSLSGSAPGIATTTLATAAIPPNSKVTSIGKDNLQQKSRTIITVPLVHLSSPGKKYASNVTVKALLENRGPKKIEDEGVKSVLQSVEATSPPTSTSLVSKTQETTMGSQSKENEIPSVAATQPTSQAVLTSITMPLSVSTGGLECSASEVIVPTVHIKVPSPNTLPSVLHNKNGTTIVQSTKVPIAMASEAKAPETALPSAGNSFLASQGNMLQSAAPLTKAVNVLPPASLSLASTAVTVPGANLLQTQQQAVKNVMLKVTPQSGGSGQYVQGFMTSRGLVIPQSALVPQQQAKNVILANVAQNGTAGSGAQTGGQQSQQAQAYASLPVQPGGTLLARQQTANLTQPQQPFQVLGAAQNSPSGPPFPNQVQKGTVISSGGLKFMLVNPVAQSAPAVPAGQASSTPSTLGSHQVLAAQQPQTSTPAAELVKQIAANSIQVQSTSQTGILNPPANSGLSPRLVQKSNVVMRAQPGIVRMSAPVVVSTTANPRASASVVQQTGLGNGGILSGQTMISNNVTPSNINPQLAAQILALQQQQQQQQQQGIVVAGGKPAAVGQQLQQQTQPGAPSVVTLQLQQLGQLFSSLTQLQPGGIQQQQPLTPGLAGGQQPGQVVQLSLNPGQTLLPGASHPQTPQLVKVAGGQVSPQIQLGNGQLQSSQGPGLVLQQPQAAQLPSQNLLMQQKPMGPSAVASGNIGLQPLLNSQQQGAGIIKLPQQAATIPVKPQISVAPSLPSPQQAMQVLQHQSEANNTNNLSTPSTPVSLSASQGFVVSPANGAAPLPGSQQQVQFVLNPSSLAPLSAASGSVAGVSPMTALNKLPGGSIRRVIRADSSLLQTNLTTSAPTVVQASNIASPAVVIGAPNQGLNSTQLQGNKQALTQMVLPTSGSAGSGQILISPMKLGTSPQANIISPLKLLGGLQVASSAAASGSQGTQILMNTNQLPGTILGKPSVIYAGQPAQLQGSAEKTDPSKMTQILLNQSNGNLMQVNKVVNASAAPVLNSQQQLLLKSGGQVLQSPAAAAAQFKQLPAGISGLSSAGAGTAKTTYLYKVGEQYFSPTGPVAVSGSQLSATTSFASGVPSGSSLLPSNLISSKADVQLLVPPASIEASEKMLLQSSKNVNAPSVSSKLHYTPSASSNSSLVASSTPSNASGAVNGTSFSFSLSGPITLDEPHSAKFTGSASQASNGQTVLREDGSSKGQLKQLSGIPTNGGDAASLTAATQQPQIVSTAATGDEEEAAMNLLTLANQAV
ncbi:hypothetical protein ElyMa_003426900 [Elysia marginata]|uniref:Bromo domain-containing protein n=1 Tax=Elysia marginata TaxID=1093978 RepID=A0AAV4JRD6_9GAST|nr:hypothetical protein ElyMa_003426900 [Elysia marginata]